ncbi:hypothetical protein FQN54_005574 [Arachnomyces sp. PD_36]|nr:hypothetical protein FQN54_005574 [Arachnomyces sp. PD_36]
MSAFMKNLAAATLLATSVPSVAAQASGSGTTTRYWDCCKPSCSWSGKADVSAPVGTCDIDDNPLSDPDADSGCEGGPAYMCSDNSPWAVDADLAYGYAAVSVAGGDESTWCCSCFELTFTSGPVSGKKMVVQAVNTGADLGSNQFDIAIPGGGVGIFDGCSTQWEEPEGGWGAQYGGISTNTCSSFPEPLSPGCAWRFDWFQNADNPSVDFTQVQCPSEITAKTGCTRSDDSSLKKAPTPKGFVKTPVNVPGAEVNEAPVAWSSTPSSSPTPSSSWVTSALHRRQWPTGSISTPSSSWPWPTPTGGWPWPTGGGQWAPHQENNNVRRQWWSSSSSPSSTPWPTQSWGGWEGGWGQQGQKNEDKHEHERRQDWPTSFPTPSSSWSWPTPTGGWPWPTGGGQWPPHQENNNVRRQWWSSSSSPSSSAWPTQSWGGWEGGWGQQKDAEHEHVRRQEWPPFSWPTSFPTSFPTPTGGWPEPTGGWPWPPMDEEDEE